VYRGRRTSLDLLATGILHARLQAQSPHSPSLLAQPPLCQCHQPRATLPVPPGQSRAQDTPRRGDAGGGGAALTVAEEAGGARALQDVVLAERPVEALRQVLGVALALPAQALAPARARLHIPGADAGFIVGGRRRGAVARVPSPGGEEMVLREAGAEHRTVRSWAECPGHECVSLWVPRPSRNPGRGTELDKVLTSPGGRCTVHKQSPHGSHTWAS